MLHKISYALFAALLFSSTSYADVDYACQNGCIGKGYTFQYCQQACSYNTNSTGSGGFAGAVMWGQGLEQQARQNQQTADQQQLLLQQRQLEIERMQLENEKLRQELRKNSSPAPDPAPASDDSSSDNKPAAHSSTKSALPDNAHPNQYTIQGWSCDDGFTRFGKSCVSE